MSDRNRFLKKIGKRFEIKRELNNKNLDSETKEYMRDSIKLLDFEIKELGNLLAIGNK